MEQGRIPDEVLLSIRERVSIVDVVGAHVSLRRAGKGWKGLCPFHAEKTPSFVVNPDTGTYHCFGCGAGGTVFRFLMEAEGRTFREAVEVLARKAGVALDSSGQPKGERRERDLLLDVLELAAKYYRHQLAAGRAGAPGRAYLEKREISAEAAEVFRLGYAPGDWDALARFLASKGVDPDLAARAGLLVERRSGGHYDRLRGRLVFPIEDPTGRVVSFGGRALGDVQPKYLNGPETLIFHKSDVLYGLAQGKDVLHREGRALLVEGYMDVVSLHARGYRAAVATLGTALTREHVQGLKRRVGEVVLLYDGDEAGRKAAFRALDVFLAEGLACRAVLLPPEHDPDSFVKAGGDLGGLVAAAPPLFELFVQELKKRSDLSKVEGRLAAVEAVVPKLAVIGDALGRDLRIREVAEALGVDERLLGARVRAPTSPEPDRRSGGGPGDGVDRAVLVRLIQDLDCRKRFVEGALDGFMVPGILRDAARFVASRAEARASLPIEEAPEGVGEFLAAILVSSEGPVSSFQTLEASLRLRDLEARRTSILGEIRLAEGRGDAAVVLALQTEKMELDAKVEAFRRSLT